MTGMRRNLKNDDHSEHEQVERLGDDVQAICACDIYIPATAGQEALFDVDGIFYPRKEARLHMIIECSCTHVETEEYLDMLIYSHEFNDIDLSWP